MKRKTSAARECVREQIKRLRKAMGLTLTQLGTFSGLPQTVLSQIEGNLRSPTLDSLNKLSKGFNRTPGFAWNFWCWLKVAWAQPQTYQRLLNPGHPFTFPPTQDNLTPYSLMLEKERYIFATFDDGEHCQARMDCRDEGKPLVHAQFEGGRIRGGILRTTCNDPGRIMLDAYQAEIVLIAGDQGVGLITWDGVERTYRELPPLSYARIAPGVSHGFYSLLDTPSDIFIMTSLA